MILTFRYQAIVAILVTLALYAQQLPAQSGFGYPNSPSQPQPNFSDTVPLDRTYFDHAQPNPGPGFNSSHSADNGATYGATHAGEGRFLSEAYDTQAPMGFKFMTGVDESRHRFKQAPATWMSQGPIPWEAFAYGEYIGPHRTPHVPEYRVRVDDRLEFIFRITRELTVDPYKLQVGDQLLISSLTENSQGSDELSQTDVTILPDGSISLRGIGQVMAARKTIAELQYELNEKYSELYTEPRVVVHGRQINTPLQDLRDSLDARQGAGGQGLSVTVLADGTINMPMIGVVPAVGLTLSELGREVNMRFRSRIQGIEFTPNVIEGAPRVAYVLGEVTTPQQISLGGPTTAMQAIAQAGGWLQGANVRQIVVFRRDANWQLMALRIDLGSALAGRNPLPADDIWLRHGDIVLVPKAPIQRISELVDLYITRTLYSVLPQQGIGTIYDADSFIGNFGSAGN